MHQRILDFLKSRNMTQRDLAAKLDISEEHLSRVLNDKTPLAPAFIGRFTQTFGWDVAAEVFGDNSQPVAPAPEEVLA